MKERHDDNILSNREHWQREIEVIKKELNEISSHQRGSMVVLNWQKKDSMNLKIDDQRLCNLKNRKMYEEKSTEPRKNVGYY